MTQLISFTDRKQIDRGVLLPNGKIVPVYYNGSIYMRFDTYFNMRTMCMFDEGDEINFADPDVTTFNKLIAEGRAKEVFGYEEFDIRVGFIKKRLTDKRIRSIVNKFRKNGFDVTEDAIRHNEDAWWLDRKSGFRDEENGYHLFSPCGCNPLEFRASTLVTQCDWQTTYTC